jgi:hypothetical protein
MSALKRTLMQDFNSFSIMFYYILAPHIKEFETYFALLYFWALAQYVINQKRNQVSTLEKI